MDDLAAGEMYARESLQVYSRSARRDLRVRASMTLADILSRENLTLDGDQLYRQGIVDAEASKEWFTLFYVSA